ncbi:hypothetical protein PCO31110_01216 [Pandoraea communis]|uniref:Uncharacterized protein n=1 Tax=Pandoraea communis TaxID=2508297 RepID=A0A5E4T3J5_9BURK|nr:hypothetical protein PCO31110_01216 [Pandoraea communis]
MSLVSLRLDAHARLSSSQQATSVLRRNNSLLPAPHRSNTIKGVAWEDGALEP